MSAGALVIRLTWVFKRENTTFSGNEDCSVTLIAICSSVFFTAHSQSPPPRPCFLSVLSIHLLHPPLLPQPLPLSAAGYREGEGKPSGADRALFQGAAWTGSLWQHQERRHSRTNVSKLLTRLPIY